MLFPQKIKCLGRVCRNYSNMNLLRLTADAGKNLNWL